MIRSDHEFCTPSSSFVSYDKPNFHSLEVHGWPAPDFESANLCDSLVWIINCCSPLQYFKQEPGHTWVCTPKTWNFHSIWYLPCLCTIQNLEVNSIKIQKYMKFLRWWMASLVFSHSIFDPWLSWSSTWSWTKCVCHSMYFAVVIQFVLSNFLS